jgi:arylsulfatase A-like enzyme
MPSTAPYQDEPWTDVEKTYAAMVTQADAHFGQLLDLLEELALTSNTVVFLTSDNGGVNPDLTQLQRFASNGPLRGAKSSLYEGGIRVPMMVRWPGVTAAGGENGQPWSFQDFFPTACDLAGVAPPAGMDGVSVAPLLRGAPLDPKRPLYWEFYAFDMRKQDYDLGRMQKAVRQGRWKAIRPTPDAPVELYDVVADAGEQANVAASHPDVLAELQQWMDQQHTPPRKPEGVLSLQYARE